MAGEPSRPTCRKQALAAWCAVVCGLFLAGCSASETDEALKSCRGEWIETFNVIFDSSLSDSDVRWLQSCMERAGYRRTYDADECKTLATSVMKPRCFVKG